MSIEGGKPIKISKAPPKIIRTLIKEDVPYDSLISSSAQSTILNFKGLYQVTFTKQKEDLEYVQVTTRQSLVGNQISVIRLAEDKTVEIYSNGNFFPPNNLIFEGYFTWKKIADLLPLDYISE